MHVYVCYLGKRHMHPKAVTDISKQQFLFESRATKTFAICLQGNKFVVAVKDYITRESTLLSFKNGDIIKLMDPEMNLERGVYCSCHTLPFIIVRQSWVLRYLADENEM